MVLPVTILLSYEVRTEIFCKCAHSPGNSEGNRLSQSNQARGSNEGELDSCFGDNVVKCTTFDFPIQQRRLMDKTISKIFVFVQLPHLLHRIPSKFLVDM